MERMVEKEETMKDASAVVLAGGESSRFGRDKATTPLLERTFTERVIEVVSPLFRKTFIGVRRRPHPLERLTIHPLIEDCIELKGPITGIYSALKAIDTPWLFAIACDMPLVRRELIRYLAEKRGNNHCVIPVARGRIQPLCAFYNKDALLEPLEGYIQSGGRNLRDFIRLNNITPCYIKEKELSSVDSELATFIDIDTTHDMTVVEEILREGMR